MNSEQAEKFLKDNPGRFYVFLKENGNAIQAVYTEIGSNGERLEKGVFFVMTSTGRYKSTGANPYVRMNVLPPGITEQL